MGKFLAGHRKGITIDSQVLLIIDKKIESTIFSSHLLGSYVFNSRLLGRTIYQQRGKSTDDRLVKSHSLSAFCSESIDFKE